MSNYLSQREAYYGGLFEHNCISPIQAVQYNRNTEMQKNIHR